jgi:hypothetical protein
MNFYGYEVPGDDGTVHFISPLPHEIAFQHGLVPEAILGTVVERPARFARIEGQRIAGAQMVNPQGLTPAHVELNPGFVRFLQQSLARHGPTLRGLLDAARSQREGFVYIIDARTPTPNGDVPVEDISGAFAVRSGSLGAFTANEHYRAVGRHGLMRMDPALEHLFLGDLTALAIRASEPH